MTEENSYPLVPTDVTDEEKQSMVAAWVAASSSAFDYTLFRIRAPGGGGQPVAADGATSGSWNMPSGSHVARTEVSERIRSPSFHSIRRSVGIRCRLATAVGQTEPAEPKGLFRSPNS
jgi:hypothetical protein